MEVQQHKKEKRRGMITSMAVHIGILLLFLIPIMKFQDPPPGQQGILVSLGYPDQGSGDDRPDTQQEEEVEPTPPSATEEVVEETEPEESVDEPVEESDPSEAPAEPETVDKEVVTAEDPDAAAIKKQQEEEKRMQEELLKKQQEEAEAKRKAEAEAKKKAEEEAKKKAEEEAKRKAEYEEAKKQFGDVFGEGKGKTDQEGNQGDPNGDPDASKLEGISTGSGVVGGGLGGREVKFAPKIQDRSQKTGTVVVKLCVDSQGNVIGDSVKFTQRGSTTADGELVNIAISNAKKFRFSASTISKQCGTITINFKLR